MVRVVSTSFVSRDEMESAADVFGWNEYNNPVDPAEVPTVQPEPSAEDPAELSDRKGVRLL